MTTGSQEQLFLQRLNEVMQRIARHGDLQAIGPLMALTGQLPPHSTLAQLAESFAHMVVKLEAREFELECRVEALQQTRQELEQAHLDPLTGLPNRVIGRDRLRQAMALARSGQRAFTLFFLDLDRFKHVNDTLGHAAGDELLVQATRRLAACLQDGDTLARLGGDEFLCVLPGCAQPGAAQAIAAGMVAALAPPFLLAAGQACIGASIGIAHYPAHGRTVDALMAFADAGLYEAKRQGRNTWAYPRQAAPLRP